MSSDELLEPPAEATPARAPVVGRSTAGGLAAEAPGDEDLITRRIEALEAGPQRVRMDLGPVEVVIEVRLRAGSGKGGG